MPLLTFLDSQQLRDSYIYNKSDGRIIFYGDEAYQINKHDKLPENSRYISSVTDIIQELNTIMADQTNIKESVKKSIQMISFVNYWKEIKKLFWTKHQLDFKKLHFFIKIPTHLGKWIDGYKVLFKFVFEEACIVYRNDHQDRLLISTLLESALVRTRFITKSQMLNRVISRKEQKYVVCELSLSMNHKTTIYLHSIKLQKDYNLSLGLTDEYFTPKILESRLIYNDYFDLNPINEEVKEIVVNELNYYKRYVFECNLKTLLDQIYYVQ